MTTEVAVVFTVKICGVTTAADARMAAAAGADCIGLNFVTGSPRQLDAAAARRVVAAVPEGVLRVGVFAGMPAEGMLALVEDCGLDAIQLHGHLSGAIGPVDPPAVCAAVKPHRVIRAVRLDPECEGTDRLATARAWMAAASATGCPPALAIVDAAVPAGGTAARLGGTGAVVDWLGLARAQPLAVPMVLAGGLDPQNVAAAIRVTGFRAVDVSSGVESAPGRKDAAKVNAFVAAARRAFAGG